MPQTFSWVALDHLAVGLEALLGDHVDGQLLVVGLLGGHQRCVGGQRVVDPDDGGVTCSLVEKPSYTFLRYSIVLNI